MQKEFDQKVIESIGHYIYCLVDPSNMEIFYIGKGNGNRIFAHLNEAIKSPQKNDKLEQIRRIRKNDKEPLHFVIRHGLSSEEEALMIESVLLDFVRLNESYILSIKNLVRGHKSREMGIKTIEDLYHQYGAVEVTVDEPALVIVINKHFKRGMSSEQLYEVTRKSWVANKTRLEKVKYVFATCNGIIREVYEVKRWFDLFDEHSQKMRYGFDGTVAPEVIRAKYLNESSAKYRGNGNPIAYINC